MRILFCGTPESAVPSLRAIAARRPEWEIPLVLSQPDRGRGRGLHVEASPVKAEAERLGLAVATPERLKDVAVRARLEEIRPDLVAVVAYGKIFRPWLLELPRLGCVNLHFSLLPRHRGVAPVAWAILDGDARTGVSTMRMDEGVDTGPAFLMRETEVRADDTCGTLTARLAEIGAPLLVETIERLAAGTIEAAAQDSARATIARKLEKEDGRIDWSLPAAAIERRVRAMDPWPGAFTGFRGSPLKIHGAGVRAGTIAPGRIVVEGATPLVGTGDGVLELRAVQAAGKSRVSGAEWLRGARIQDGEMLGDART
jgi:methionyl-tRNA formyltransferase